MRDRAAAVEQARGGERKGAGAHRCEPPRLGGRAAQRRRDARVARRFARAGTARDQQRVDASWRKRDGIDRHAVRHAYEAARRRGELHDVAWPRPLGDLAGGDLVRDLERLDRPGGVEQERIGKGQHEDAAGRGHAASMPGNERGRNARDTTFPAKT